MVFQIVVSQLVQKFSAARKVLYKTVKWLLVVGNVPSTALKKLVIHNELLYLDHSIASASRLCNSHDTFYSRGQIQ